MTLHYATLQFHYPRLHYTRLHYNYSCNYNYATCHCTTLAYSTFTFHYITLRYITLHHTHYALQRQLQLHYTSYTYITTTTPLHYNYNYSCTTPHYIQQLWVRNPATMSTTPERQSSNHLSDHQWIRSAICDSQQPNSPTSVLFWNFRHCLVRYS